MMLFWTLMRRGVGVGKLAQLRRVLLGAGPEAFGFCRVEGDFLWRRPLGYRGFHFTPLHGWGLTGRVGDCLGTVCPCA